MRISFTDNKQKISRLRSLFYLTLALGIPFNAKAAALTQILSEQLPQSVNPARIGNLVPSPLAPAVSAQVSVPGFTPRAVSAEATRTTFVLHQLNITGSSVYGNTQLANMFRNYIGRSVSLADLQQMADAITIKYRNDGYVITRAVLPAQDIRGGIVTIRVVEGFVNHISIEGDPRGARKLLEQYGDQIEQRGRPLNIATLERYALLASDIPGVDVHIVLGPAQIPGDELAPSEIVPGAANLTFVVEQHMASGYFTFDNRGTKYLGPNEFSFGANINSIFRSGDSTGFQGLVTPNIHQLQYGRIYHQTPLGDNGVVLNLAASYSHTKPNYTLSQLDVVGTSNTLFAGISYPVIRGREQSLFVNTDLDTSNTKSDALGVNLYNDRLRSFRAGANYNLADSWLGINQAGGQVSQGITAFNASPNDSNDTSRPNGHSDYTKFNLSASRLQGLPYNFSFLVAGQGQYALDTVLSVEEFAFGGAQFGQAYDPAAITGDSGMAGKAELRYDTSPDWRVLHGVQLFTVYDIGKIWNIHPLGLPFTQSAASVAAGVRMNFTNFLSGSIEVAKPLTLKVETTNSRDPRVFFSVTLAGDTPAGTTALPLPPTFYPAPTGVGLTSIGGGLHPIAPPPIVNFNPPQLMTKAAPPVATPAPAAPAAVATPTAAASNGNYQGLTPVSNNVGWAKDNVRVHQAASPITQTSSNQSDDYYSLQLKSGRDFNDLQSFVDHHNLNGKTHIIRTQHNGSDWYVLTYGKFDSPRAAAAARMQLPAVLQGLHPWVRHVTG